MHSLHTDPPVQARLRRRDWIKTGTGLAVVAALGMPASGGAGATEMTTETRDQGMPAFYAQAPSLILRDPLAQFLGAAQDGVMEYRYADAVRLAGCHRQFEFFRVEVDQCQFGALGSQVLGHGATQPLAAASDNDYFVFKLHECPDLDRYLRIFIKES